METRQIDSLPRLEDAVGKASEVCKKAKPKTRAKRTATTNDATIEESEPKAKKKRVRAVVAQF